MATFLFSVTSPFIQATFLSVLLVNVHPKHMAFSAEVTPFLKVEKSLKCLYSSKCLLSKSHFQYIESSCSTFLTFKEHLMQTCIYVKAAIVSYAKNTNGTTHTCVWQMLLHNHTCYNFIPCTKWHGSLYCRLYSIVSHPGFRRTSLRVPWEIME